MNIEEAEEDVEVIQEVSGEVKKKKKMLKLFRRYPGR